MIQLSQQLFDLKCLEQGVGLTYKFQCNFLWF